MRIVRRHLPFHAAFPPRRRRRMVGNRPLWDGLRFRLVYSAIGRLQGRGKVERLFGHERGERLWIEVVGVVDEQRHRLLGPPERLLQVGSEGPTA